MNDDALPALKGLDTARGLRLFAGQAAVYREVLQDFSAQYAQGIAGASAWLSQPTPEQLTPLRRAVHSLGGAGAAIGATEIERLSKAFEGALREPQLGESDRDPHILLASLCDELAALVNALRLKYGPP